MWTLGKANINDYTLSPGTGVSRFGAIHEVEDEINTYQLLNKKSFNESIDETNGRVTVMINIFGRSTPVELEYWQIEAL